MDNSNAIIDIELLDKNIEDISQQLDNMLLGTDTGNGAMAVGAPTGLTRSDLENAQHAVPQEFSYFTDTLLQQQQQCKNDIPTRLQTQYLAHAVELYNQQAHDAIYSNAADTQVISFSVNDFNKSASTATVQKYCPYASYIQSDTRKLPLLTLAADNKDGKYHDGNDCFGLRRKQKLYNRENTNTKLTQLDYDKIDVDLSLIGLTTKSYEQSAVLRLFSLFRRMHLYLHETVPSRFQNACYDEYEDDFSPRATMPATMSVHTQIKQALHKCHVFFSNAQQILNSNKLNDRQMYANCERSIKALQKLIKKLETFKGVNFDHNYGKFLKDESSAHAGRLELLLEQINDAIRENKLYLHLFDWSMEAKRKRAQSLCAGFQQQCKPEQKYRYQLQSQQQNQSEHVQNLGDFDKQDECYFENLESNSHEMENAKNINTYKKLDQLEKYFNYKSPSCSANCNNNK